MTPEQLLAQVEFFASASAVRAVAVAAHDQAAAAIADEEAAAALGKITAAIEQLTAELKATQNARLLSVVFGHHKGAPKPFVLQHRNGHAVVALGAEFPDGAVALRLANDGGWTTASDGGAEHFRDESTEIVWLSDELDPLAEMEQDRDRAVTELAEAKAQIDELRAEQRYREALGRGLSDYEAREEGWPTVLAEHERAVTDLSPVRPIAGHCIRCRPGDCDGCFYCQQPGSYVAPGDSTPARPKRSWEALYGGPPQEVHGWTWHGHRCCDQAGDQKPGWIPGIWKCGGSPQCPVCKTEVERMAGHREEVQ